MQDFPLFVAQPVVPQVQQPLAGPPQAAPRVTGQPPPIPRRAPELRAELSLPPEASPPQPYPQPNYPQNPVGPLWTGAPAYYRAEPPRWWNREPNDPGHVFVQIPRRGVGDDNPIGYRGGCPPAPSIYPYLGMLVAGLLVGGGGVYYFFVHRKKKKSEAP